MEATGVYWRPVFNVLEAGHAVLLVNPQHMRAVPGRKTDVKDKDSEWLADLLRHGLVQPSFIPPAPIRELRELRELARHRKALVQQRTRGGSIGCRRCSKALEGARRCSKARPASSPPWRAVCWAECP